MIKYCSVLKKLKFSTCSNVDALENILCEKVIYKEEDLLRSHVRCVTQADTETKGGGYQRP